MTKQDAILIEGLNVVRGGRHVLRDLSLTIPGGSVTGLLGPSGCGKTTLMRSIVGVQLVESGRVTVLGREAGSPALRSRVGYVTQAPSVYADLSVEENLGYFRSVLGAPGSSVDEALATVGLSSHKGQPAKKLSGGQLARLSLATALLNDPEVLVLDEPTVGLDPVLRQELWTTFRELAARGTTLLVSSHVMDEAERCDHLLLMREGVILAADTPDGLLQRTGASNVEHAFLNLIGEKEMAA